MAVSTELQVVDRDLIVRMTGTPEERSSMLAEYAREQLLVTLSTSAVVLGYVLTFIRIVDGVLGLLEDQVKPEGEIEYDFDVMGEVVTWIYQQLVIHSPVGSGRDPHPGLYRASHVLFADGDLVDPDQEIPTTAAEYVFANATPYTRKIERWDGVYEAVAALAAVQFGELAAIRFTFRAIDQGGLVPAGRPSRQVNDLRVPAIVVTRQ